MRTVVMSSESRDIPLRNLYPNATGLFLSCAHNGGHARNKAVQDPRDLGGWLDQAPAFGVRWEAERYTAFLLRKGWRTEKAPSSLRFAGAVQNTAMSAFGSLILQRSTTLGMTNCPYIFAGTSMPSNFKPRCRTRPVRSHSAKRDARTGSSAFKTGQA